MRGKGNTGLIAYHLMTFLYRILASGHSWAIPSMEMCVENDPISLLDVEKSTCHTRTRHL